MKETNYEIKLEKARNIALSGRANEMESDLLGPYTRHLLTEIAHFRPNLDFYTLKEADLPQWWEKDDRDAFEKTLASLKVCFQSDVQRHFDADLSCWHLSLRFEQELRGIEDTRNYPRSGDIGDFGFHLVKEIAHYCRTNRLDRVSPEELPTWWTKEERALFFSLVTLKKMSTSSQCFTALASPTV